MALVLLTVSISACSTPSCPERLRLDRLLEGGLPICLGESWSQIDAHAEQGTFDSFGWFDVGNDSVSYAYVPGGGLDLISAHPLATVMEGCVFLKGDSAKAAELPHRIMIRLGARWRQIMAQENHARWVSSEQIMVSFSNGTTVCVAARPR